MSCPDCGLSYYYKNWQDCVTELRNEYQSKIRECTKLKGQIENLKAKIELLEKENGRVEI